MAAEPTPRPAKPCPVCDRPPDPRLRPFCSARCRQVDLGRWLAGDYAIPGEEDEARRGEEPERE
ncbi:MAG TPA: DNA gyrase inhibitor YacG [Crenalkalicoccus sp.]|jgi:endogenous inhibitor of DNA gyrase (YacG/DUF329 family)|nr:DNA gyrase inhibitor YacG [Crenalkalicoccus sp.]